MSFASFMDRSFCKQIYFIEFIFGFMGACIRIVSDVINLSVLFYVNSCKESIVYPRFNFVVKMYTKTYY